jgi:hypothetical protein
MESGWKSEDDSQCGGIYHTIVIGQWVVQTIWPHFKDTATSPR